VPASGTATTLATVGMAQSIDALVASCGGSDAGACDEAAGAGAPRDGVEAGGACGIYLHELNRERIWGRTSGKGIRHMVGPAGTLQTHEA
jgi:hypothetical protein